MSRIQHAIVLSLALCGASVLHAQLPGGPGLDALQANCTACHDFSRAVSARQDREGWQGTLAKMKDLGMPADTEALELMLDYLSANLPAGAPPPVNINEANAVELVQNFSLLRSEARALIRYRDEHGPFTTLEDLQAVPDVDFSKFEANPERIAFTIDLSGLVESVMAGGDVNAGRTLFENQCSSCHRFGDLGTEFGPDLTTIASRYGVSDILESLLYPSKAISKEYASTIIELDDGQLLNCIVVDENDQSVTVRTAEATDGVELEKSQIMSRRSSDVSIMPENLLDTAQENNIRNLIAFLKSGATEHAAASTPQP